jgi:sporulation-control protein spo0M
LRSASFAKELVASQGVTAARVSTRAAEPEWMRGFGKLRRLHTETKRIQDKIREAFEVLEPEDRA